MIPTGLLLTYTVTFVHTTNPYEDPGSLQELGDAPELDQIGQFSNHEAIWQPSTGFHAPQFSARGSTHGLEALSAAASGDRYLQSLRTAEPLSGLAQTAAAREASYVLDQPGNISPQIDPQLSDTIPSVPQMTSVQGLSSFETSVLENEVKADNDVPFLLRYFSEGPGAWMDLYDLNSFFAVDVPVKASTCPLLLYAAIALSAKALGRIRISAQYIKQSASKRTPSQWLHKARYYYDLAISLLRQALENGTRPGSATAQVSQVSADTIRSPGTANESIDAFPQWRELHGARGITILPGTDSDEMVATTAILCVYEFLDASGLEWARHLDGAKSLFDIATDGTLPLIAQPSGLLIPLSSSNKGRRAVFWNVCRQEMIDACK